VAVSLVCIALWQSAKTSAKQEKINLAFDSNSPYPMADTIELGDGGTTMARKDTKTTYSVHPSVVHARAIIKKLPEKTSRSIEEWVELIKKSGPTGNKECREWLKKKHKLGGTTAWLVADRAEGKGAEDTDEQAYLKAAAQYVEKMYSDPKASLRPIYDELLRLGNSLGKDVKVSPCKTIVPLYRNRVFAEIKPSTRTRIDLGFALGDLKPKGRLIDTGGFAKKDRITHRIPISSLDEIDDEVKRWLKQAYDRDAQS
jgi:hypothetical protein